MEQAAHPSPSRPNAVTAAAAYDIDANYEAYVHAATLEIIGDPVRAVARDSGIGHNQARRVGTICGKSIEEFREHARRNKQLIMDLIDQRLPELVGKLKPMEAFVAAGIMADKYRDMTGGTAPTSVHITNIQVNGTSRDEALAALTGTRKALIETRESFSVPTQIIVNATPADLETRPEAPSADPGT